MFSILKLLNKRKEWKPSDAPGILPPSGKVEEEAEMSFLDHLEELRWHLIRSVLAISIFAIVAFLYIREIMEKIILAPFHADFPANKMICEVQPDYCIDGIKLDFIAIDPYEQFLMAFTSSFFIGLSIAFPYVIWEIWRFIRPGLHPKEQKSIRWSVFAISTLFFIGLSFSYFVITPFSVSFLSGFQIAGDVSNQWKIGNVVSLVTQLVLGGALLFELPVIVYYLSKLGILTPQFMKIYYRHAIVILMIIAAIISPPDVISMFLIFIPLLALYQISIWVSAAVQRNKLKEEIVNSNS